MKGKEGRKEGRKVGHQRKLLYFFQRSTFFSCFFLLQKSWTSIKNENYWALFALFDTKIEVKEEIGGGSKTSREKERQSLLIINQHTLKWNQMLTKVWDHQLIFLPAMWQQNSSPPNERRKLERSLSYFHPSLFDLWSKECSWDLKRSNEEWMKNEERRFHPL